jgi:predicted nucleic acid-binding protein
MSVLLLDTNIVSVLFKPDHALHRRSFEIVGGHQWFISFMTRGELLLWPRVNHWGPMRREELTRHIELYDIIPR